jgi:UDP-glucose 4-epimerase
MKTVLITGVAGFIGSNLAEHLLGRGYRVAGIDNLSQGDFRNIESLLTHSAFEFHKLDVRYAGELKHLIGKSDCVVHLAAFKIPRYGNAMDTLVINTHGTRNVLEGATQNKCRVVLASTSDVYGRNPNVPFNEESDLWLGPTTVKRWAYASSKLYDEHLCFAYRDKFGVPIVIVRLFGGYGPRQNTTWWGGPQAVFIQAALQDLPMEIHGDGMQTRSFTYIADHVDGLTKCIESDKAAGEVFNLGNTEEIRIYDLATLIWGLAAKGEPKYNFVSYRTFGKYEDVERRVPDISKARRILGFEPSTGLKDGLARTIEWQKSYVGQQP